MPPSDPETTRSSRLHDPAMVQSSSDDIEQERTAAAESLRVAVRSMCHSLDVELTAAREQQLTSLSLERLLDLVTSLNASRSWPDGF